MGETEGIENFYNFDHVVYGWPQTMIQKPWPFMKMMMMVFHILWISMQKERVLRDHAQFRLFILFVYSFWEKKVLKSKPA